LIRTLSTQLLTSSVKDFEISSKSSIISTRENDWVRGVGRGQGAVFLGPRTDGAPQMNRPIYGVS